MLLFLNAKMIIVYIGYVSLVESFYIHSHLLFDYYSNRGESFQYLSVSTDVHLHAIHKILRYHQDMKQKFDFL